jgi:Raf kinase inhibitor-like YbhB/YbcL family protein
MTMRKAFHLTIFVMCLLLFYGYEQAVAQKKGGKAMELKSTAFRNGEMIPAPYTCDGKDASPPLEWSAFPEGTKSFALICDDPDAPVGTWVHWVIYNLHAETTKLPENVPRDKKLTSGGMQGTNDWHRIGYGGPCPPSGIHRYFFRLYALDSILNLGTGATKEQLLTSMKSHVLAEGQLMGKYKR